MLGAAGEIGGFAHAHCPPNVARCIVDDSELQKSGHVETRVRQAESEGVFEGVDGHE